MATRKERRAASRAAQYSRDTQTADSMENLQARLGVNNVDNLASATTYTLNPLTRRRYNLEMLYRGSWIIAVAIDCVADDMTRAGIDFSTDVEPDDAEALQAEFQEKQIWHQLGDAIRWARLFGGALAVYMIDGQDLSTPLKIETIKKDQFKGFYVMDRWQVLPSYHEPVEDYGPDFGKPKFYEVVADQSVVAGMRSPLFGKKIHYSRVLRFEGEPLPFYQRMAEFGWGMSIVERIYDRLIAFDSATQGAAQLVYKAHLRTLKIEGLTQILSMGGPALDTLVTNIDQIRKLQSSEGLTVIDAKNEMEYNSYAFTGLPEIVLQFGQQISGAIQVPMVRLFGQSPTGMNATGESDLRIYYDGINKDQENDLRTPITKTIEIMYRSLLGKDLPEGFNFTFSPLWQMSNVEKAQHAQIVTTAITQAEANGTIDHATALKELRRASQINGIFTSIEDEDINAAENEPPDMGEMQFDPIQAEQLKMHPQMKPHLQEAIKVGKASAKVLPQPPKPPGAGKPSGGAGKGADGLGAQDKGYDPNEPRIPSGHHGGGRWTRGLGSEEESGLMDRLNAEGGFTYNVFEGKSPKPGEGALILSPYKDREHVLDMNKIKPIDLARYVINNIDKLKQPNHYFGAWVDEGKAYLDVSIVTHDRKTAEALCKKHNQLAYFDLDKMETVYTEKREAA